MSLAQTLSFWATTGAYLLATVMFFYGLAWRKRHLMRRASRIIVPAGLVAHVVALGIRWTESGHFPYIGNYEGALFGAFLLALAFAVLVFVWEGGESTGLIVLPVLVVTLGYGLVQMEAVGPVTPVYQSPWLLVHFVFSWTTYAVYTVVAALAGVLLLRLRAERRGKTDRSIAAWAPPNERIDEISTPLVGFGFLMNALLLVTGSIWAYRLWGQYWGWDPVEIWSLLTWLGYGFYLHARLTLGWSGRKLAWVAIISLLGISMATWGVQFLPTSYHLFQDLGATMFQSRPQ